VSRDWLLANRSTLFSES